MPDIKHLETFSKSVTPKPPKRSVTSLQLRHPLLRFPLLWQQSFRGPNTKLSVRYLNSADLHLMLMFNGPTIKGVESTNDFYRHKFLYHTQINIKHIYAYKKYIVLFLVINAQSFRYNIYCTIKIIYPCNEFQTTLLFFI